MLDLQALLRSLALMLYALRSILGTLVAAEMAEGCQAMPDYHPWPTTGMLLLDVF